MKNIIIYSPEALLMHNFLRLLGLNFSYTQICNTINENYRLNVVQKFINVASVYGISLQTVQLSLNDLKNISCPLIVFTKRDNLIKYILIYKMNKKLIKYYEPIGGDDFCSLSYMKTLLSDMLLVSYLKNDSDLANIKEWYKIKSQYYIKHNMKILNNFISAEDCNEIIKLANKRNSFKRSPVADENGKIFYSSSRTSFTAILKSKNSLALSNLYKKVSSYLSIPRNHIEHIECVKYENGQEFKPHWDTDNTEDRVHTIIIYLTDEFEGGETYFPLINLKVTPVKGDALHFTSRNKFLKVISASLHAGLPVRNGTKYACNIWVRNTPVPQGHYSTTGVLL